MANFVTVAICTWNRADSLRRTLQHMMRLKQTPFVEWELLVVNNNSKDHTEKVAHEFQRRLPLQCVHEHKQGLANARNYAIRVARGDVIIWTDDDVLVDDNWLVYYIDAFKRNPAAAFFGGPIVPLFADEAPGWILQNMEVFRVVYGYRDLGPEQQVITDANHLPYGANMAVRKYIYQYFDYDPNLGMQGMKRVMGEETIFFRRLLENGYTGIWWPSVGIKHVIQKEQLNRSYIKKYFQSHGATLVRSIQKGDEPWSYIGDIPRWLLKELANTYAKWLFAIIAKKRERESLWAQLQSVLGEVKEYRARVSVRS